MSFGPYIARALNEAASWHQAAHARSSSSAASSSGSDSASTSSPAAGVTNRSMTRKQQPAKNRRLSSSDDVSSTNSGGFSALGREAAVVVDGEVMIQVAANREDSFRTAMFISCWGPN